MTILVRELRAEIERLQEELNTANANHENAVAHMQSVCAERDRLASWAAKLERSFRWYDKCHWGVRKPKWLIAIQEKLEEKEQQP